MQHSKATDTGYNFKMWFCNKYVTDFTTVEPLFKEWGGSIICKQCKVPLDWWTMYGCESCADFYTHNNRFCTAYCMSKFTRERDKKKQKKENTTEEEIKEYPKGKRIGKFNGKNQESDDKKKENEAKTLLDVTNTQGAIW
jgi:hypothetical protein